MRSNSKAYALCACARDREEKLGSSTRIETAETRPVGFAWEREIYIGVTAWGLLLLVVWVLLSFRFDWLMLLCTVMCHCGRSYTSPSSLNPRLYFVVLGGWGGLPLVDHMDATHYLYIRAVFWSVIIEPKNTKKLV